MKLHNKVFYLFLPLQSDLGIVAVKIVRVTTVIPNVFPFSPTSKRKRCCYTVALLPLFIRWKLRTSKINCEDKIWRKPCLFTFSSGK